MRTKILIILAALGVIGSALYLSQPALAEGGSGYSAIIQKLVERFGLDAGEVEEVFVEHRGEMRAEKQARLEERLDEAVAEGKITQEQREALEAKKAEMKENWEEMKDLSWEERKEVKSAHWKEMKAWAEENGIDMKELFGFMGGFKKGHFGHKFGE